ncbi:two-component system sensor histidine kinase NtrB [Oceanibacterium hippocampi]|uniref:two-component system sensor histidine kinase NtrB n=1 Tax=Oceanibacterium hippocampi TaxID=745714 RepID=UPI001593B404|nr:PAS domain-containing hybrid sensor histidine kinase/response regulator [Oceanibacterium hippocampi]
MPGELYAYQEIAKRMNQVFWADNPEQTKNLFLVGNYEELYGRSAAPLESDPLDWLNAVHPDDREAVEARLPLQAAGSFDMTFRVVHPDGTLKWLHDRAFLVRDPEGKPLYHAGIVEDVTEARLLEERLRQDQTMTAIGALAGGVAHDFNNLLAIVLGNLDIALAGDLPAPLHEALTRALDAADRGAGLTRRLLAYSRRQLLTPGPIDGAAFLRGRKALIEDVLGAEISLRIAIEDGLWTCFADDRDLETALVNLAINGHEAMTAGGTLTIAADNVRLDARYATRHAAVTAGDYVRFSVTDTGAGMTAAVVDQAFEPFFTTKGVGHVSGLGLAMAYGFARQSGGHITLHSAPGKGTTVELYLPRLVPGPNDGAGPAA